MSRRLFNFNTGGILRGGTSRKLIDVERSIGGGHVSAQELAHSKAYEELSSSYEVTSKEIIMRLPLRGGAIALTILTGVGIGAAALRRQANPEVAACMSNLRQMSLGALMYTQDYDKRIPPMKSIAVTQKLLQPYIKNNQVFTCPVTSKAYRLNPAIGGKNVPAVAHPVKTVLFFDAAAHTDGKYSVAYLDGHVARESKIPTISATPTNRRTRSRKAR